MTNVTKLRSFSNKKWWLGVLVVLVLACVFGVRAVQERHQPPPGTTTHTVTVDGHERSYLLYIPRELPTGKVPLVVMMHGALGNGQQAQTAYGWDQKADEQKFLVAYPNGLHRSWVVSDGCCGPSVNEGVNDVAFIEQMVEDIVATNPIEVDKVYATGISNGGMLAYRLACDTDTFTAIGVVAATQLGECSQPRPTSVLHIHGTADQTVPYQGGPGKRDNAGQGRNPADTAGPPIEQLIASWKTINDCQPPDTTVNGSVTTAAAVCEQGRAVTLIAIDGAGHQWPGSANANPRAEKLLNLDPPSTALNATNTLWQFFSGISAKK
jgi:polyhydroxybutyrate depolymerase